MNARLIRLRTKLTDPGNPAVQLAAAATVGLFLGAACLKLSPLLVLMALLAVVGAVVICSWPEVGLLVIVALTCGLVDGERFLLSVGPISLYATDVLLVYLLGIAAARVLAERDFGAVGTPLDTPLIWFFLAVVFSATLAVIWFSVDARFVIRRLRPLVYYLGYFAATNLIRDRRQLRRLIEGLFLIAVFAALLMLVQLLVPSLNLGVGSRETLITAGQEFGNIVRTWSGAERLIYPMLIVSVASLAHRGAWLRPAVEAGRAAILGLGLFLTFQRNYWLTVFLMVAALLFMLSPRQRGFLLKWALLGLVLVALAAQVFPPARLYLGAAYDRLFRGMQLETLTDDTSSQMRVVETRYALQAIVRYPLLGIGLGNVYRPEMEGDAYWMPEDPSLGLRWFLHNAYLSVWVRHGLLGLIPFVWLYGAYLWRGLVRWRRIPDPRWRTAALGFTLAMGGQMISNIVAANLIQSWSLIVFAIMLGVNELIYRWELPSSRGGRAQGQSENGRGVRETHVAYAGESA